MDLLALAAEIGGFLGLWLGFSVLDIYSTIEAALTTRLSVKKSLFV